MFMRPRTQEEPLIILPRRSWLTHLVIMDRHERSFHLGAHSTLAILRREFWIVRGLSTVKCALRKCRPCRRVFLKTYNSPEGGLPSFRTTPSPAFANMGTDLMGPVHLETGQKAWVLLVICAVTRAVHFELCLTCSAAELAMKFRKIFALRTPPLQTVRIWSDNALAFRRLAKLKFPQTKIEWRFIPPLAPWMGFWEKIFSFTKNR